MEKAPSPVRIASRVPIFGLKNEKRKKRTLPPIVIPSGSIICFKSIRARDIRRDKKISEKITYIIELPKYFHVRKKVSDVKSSTRGY